MAPPAGKISQQEWERYDDIIHNLYHIRGLPLHSEKGDPSVLQIMRDEHHFSASLSQYEAYFKKRDQPKNLKKEEWRAVHAKLSELSAKNIEARVKLSGHVLSPTRIKRSRRYAFAGLEQPRDNSSNGVTLPPTHRVTIEIRGADGKWSAYTGRDTVADTQSLQGPADNHAILGSEEPSALVPTSEYKSTPFGDGFASSPHFLHRAANSHVFLGLEASSSLGHVNENKALILSNQELPLFDSPSSPWHDSFFLAEFGSSIDIGYPWSFDRDVSQISRQPPVAFPSPSSYETPFMPQHWAGESPFFQLRTALLVKPKQGIYSQHKSPKYTGAGHGRDLPQSIEPRISPEILVQSLLEDAAQVLIGNSMSCEVMKLPDPDDVMDSLLSLLPESQVQDQTAELAPMDVIFGSPFYSALLFSIANGFAGLRNIPSGAMFRMLKRQHQMSSRLFDCLRSCPPALAKALADNLFRAAVEACDEQAVIIILQTTRNLPNAIDPNEIVCQLDGKGRLYTPIELAAKFRHLGIVQTLLAANADVNKTHEEINKTHEESKRQERGALELAIRKWGEYEAVDMNLVRTLLDCHAEVRVDLVSAVIRWGQTDLIRELISRLPPNSHRSCFSSMMLQESARFLGNSLATQIIKQLFEYCQVENCMRCSADSQDQMKNTLCYAARKGNIELVEFLLPHATNKNGGLSAAVTKGSRELINLFLQHGASVCELTYSPPFREMDRLFPSANGSKQFYARTTPLAEAIRSQNKDLVQEFEIGGALSCIDQEEYFKAVIFAAAEVGDCHYVQKLLERVSEKRGNSLTAALSVAIYNDQTKAALILLGHGANVNKDFFTQGLGPPLLEALKRQNKTIVEAILEADVDVNPHHRWRGPVMEPAGLWGDISIVEDLILMGADIDAGEQTTALAAAVKSKNRAIVELLLKSGASPSKCAESGASALEAAIANEDDDMIRLLFSNSADPANVNAFLFAIENNQQAFDILLKAFSARYPQGKKNFGANLLINAIEKGNATLLNAMLTASFDVNSFSRQNKTLVNALGFAIMYQKGRHLELVQKLIDAGGDPDGIVRKPLNDESSFTRKAVPLETALIVAIKTRSEQMVELLLKNGADLHRPARRGLKRTPLQQACEIGSFKIVKLLLEKGANVNEPPADWGGGTALQQAAISGSIKIANLLLAHGALVHASPAKVNGRSAFEGAAEHGCIEMIGVLRNAVSEQGFPPGQIEKAIRLAKSRGHRGCAEYIADLFSEAAFPLLQTDPFIDFQIE